MFNDPDVVAVARWMQLVPGSFNRSSACLRSERPFDEGKIVEDWARPRKAAGPLVPVVGLVSESSFDGWFIAPGQLSFLQKELADILIKSRKVRLAKPSELPSDD